MLVENHQQLYRIYFLSLISIEVIFHHQRIIRNSFIKHFLSFTLIRNGIKFKRTSINSFNTHLLSLVALKNKLYCRRKNIIDSFITHYLSLSNQGQIITHVNNYQQLYSIFL